MSKKKEPTENIEDTINRGKSNTCRITMAEDALKNQRAEICCLINGHKWEYKVINEACTNEYYCYSIIGTACICRNDPNIVPTATRTCTVCGKTEQIAMPDKIMNKIKKLFKGI